MLGCSQCLLPFSAPLTHGPALFVVPQAGQAFSALGHPTVTGVVLVPLHEAALQNLLAAEALWGGPVIVTRSQQDKQQPQCGCSSSPCHQLWLPGVCAGWWELCGDCSPLGVVLVVLQIFFFASFVCIFQT